MESSVAVLDKILDCFNYNFGSKVLVQKIFIPEEQLDKNKDIVFVTKTFKEIIYSLLSKESNCFTHQTDIANLKCQGLGFLGIHFNLDKYVRVDVTENGVILLTSKNSINEFYTNAMGIDNPELNHVYQFFISFFELSELFTKKNQPTETRNLKQDFQILKTFNGSRYTYFSLHSKNKAIYLTEQAMGSLHSLNLLLVEFPRFVNDVV